MPEIPLSRRPSPFLLIIPVVLTIIGVALSVVLYLNHYHKDPGKGSLAKEEAAREELERVIQVRDAILARKEAFVDLLGYSGNDAQEWLDGRLEGQPDFKTAMDTREAETQTLQRAVNDLSDTIGWNTKEIKRVQGEKHEIVQRTRGTIDQRLKAFDKVDQSFGPDASDRLQRYEKAGQTVMEKKDESTRQGRRRIEKKQEQDDATITIQRQVEDLEEVAADRRSCLQGVDARVVSVIHGSDRVTVDIGRRQRVRSGVRFKVVEKGQTVIDPNKPESGAWIPETAVIKAEIEIVRVDEEQSTAVVLDFDLSKPILPGDAVFNPGYDPDHRTRFIVVGQIDLTENGSHDGELLERVIADVGGVIEGKVSIRTDFLLKGADWPTDDPELRKRWYRDQDQIKAAEDLSVSFLSVRPFLKYVGVRVGRDGVVRPVEFGT